MRSSHWRFAFRGSGDLPSSAADLIDIYDRSSMNSATQVQHGMSPQVKRGVTRWAARETLGVVMLGVLLFLAAGTVNWLAGWAMVFVMAGWVIATAAVVIPRYPE